jgi:uncharacterized protein (DUF2147 family)
MNGINHSSFIGIMLLICMTLLTTNLSAQSSNEKILVGKWLTEDNDVIEFYNKNNTYEGKLILANDKAAVAKHPEIIGAVIFKKLKITEEGFGNGNYHDIESDADYAVSIKVVDVKTIKLKFGTGLFSQTSVFKKII